MASKGEDLWFLKLDFDWMHDAKIVRLKAKYGKAILVDVVNVFILMAKCDGVADMGDPAHADWAASYVGKSGKALASTLDKLAEFGLINKEIWEGLGHVTNNRAVTDARERKRAGESGRQRTEKARAALAAKREAESAARTVTDSVTATVTESADSDAATEPVTDT